MIGSVLHSSGGIISCPWRGQCRGLIHDIGIQYTSDEDTQQGGGAMALVVVGHRPAAAGLQRQAWLGAVEGLDLALLVGTTA